MTIYTSQLGQDIFVDEYFKCKTNGVFVDIGAHDGKSASNTYFLEKTRKWTGICIEPGPNEFKELSKNRSSVLINACVSDYDGQSEFTYLEGYSNMLSGLSENYDERHKNRIDKEIEEYGGIKNTISMPVFKLQTILDKYQLHNIDYCSLDTEGSELNILKSIDFEKTKIKLFSIENNFGENVFEEYLKDFGFELLTKLKWDDIFVNTTMN